MPASAWESLGLQDPDSFRVDPPVTPAGPLKDDRTLFAKANDWMIDAGNAAASLAGAGVSFVSPDGGAAKSIADFIKEGEGNQSDYRQKLRAELGQLIEDAKANGDTGTLAWLQHNLSNPVTELLPQAVGNFGPFAAAGKVAGGLGAARAAAGGATAAEAATAGTSAALGATSTLGGVVGAGGVRQGYYEEIQKATDEQLLKESPEYRETPGDDVRAGRQEDPWRADESAPCCWHGHRRYGRCHLRKTRCRTSVVRQEPWFCENGRR